MLQCFAGCEDPEMREGVRRVWRDLVELIERVSGEPPEVVSAFFAKGMLLNVLNAMQLFDDPDPLGRPADRRLRAEELRVRVAVPPATSFFVSLWK